MTYRATATESWSGNASRSKKGHADMIEIIFHDDELETSDVLLHLLDLYHSDPLPEFNS
jgi:hypothetical protein